MYFLALAGTVPLLQLALKRDPLVPSFVYFVHPYIHTRAAGAPGLLGWGPKKSPVSCTRALPLRLLFPIVHVPGLPTDLQLQIEVRWNVH